MDPKNLAHRIRDLFGGVPQVFLYWNTAHDKSVPVLSSEGRPEEGLTSWATVGMSEFDNQLMLEDGRPIRVELLAVCQSEFSAMGRVLSGCAFNVADGDFVASPGVIFPNAIRVNDDSVRMKHAMLVSPFLWDGQPLPIEESDRVTTFLQVVPVDDDEFAYARANGVEALEDRFTSAQIDVYDLNRLTAV